MKRREEKEHETKKHIFIKSPIEWLLTAGMVYESSQVKEKVTLPLSSADETNFRLYLMDLGFLAYQSGINMSTFVNPSVKNTLSGAFFENHVANELQAKNIPLFFWKGKDNSEFEFLIDDQNNVIPLDVKKGKGQLPSIKKFKEHNEYTYSVKISTNNYGYDKENNILTLPLYMLFAYLNDLKERNSHIE